MAEDGAISSMPRVMTPEESLIPSRPSSRERASSKPMARTMAHTASSASRAILLANVPSAHRGLAPTGGTEWHQQTPSYLRMVGQFGAIGAPGQDLRRLASGPALYINGPPDKGPKATIATIVANRRAGDFSKEKLGPGSMITLLLMHQPPCKRSTVGPDPYDMTVRANQRREWHGTALRAWPGFSSSGHAAFSPCFSKLRAPPLRSRCRSWPTCGGESSA